MNKYFENITFYENKVPFLDENVLVIFTEYKDTHIEAKLIEYDNINGLMIYEDATRKKKVYDWKKEIQLNKLTVAKVEEIYENNYVKLSTGYFDHRKDPDELNKELMKPFNDNKILINIIKKICYNKVDFNIFWQNIIYKILKNRNEYDFNFSLYEYFIENIETVKKSILDDENFSTINLDDLDKLINNKNYKIETKITIYSKSNINDITKIFSNIKQNINDFEYSIKYLTSPFYIITSIFNESNEENHNKIIEYIKENINDNIIFNVEYIAKKI